MSGERRGKCVHSTKRSGYGLFVWEIADRGCWLPLFGGIQGKKYTPPLPRLSLALNTAVSSRARGLWIDRSALIALSREPSQLSQSHLLPSAQAGSLLSASILNVQNNCLRSFLSSKTRCHGGMRKCSVLHDYLFSVD